MLKSKFLLVGALVFVSACVPTFKNLKVDTIPEDATLLLLNSEIMFDGSAGSNCGYFLSDTIKYDQIKTLAFEKRELRLLQLPSDKEIQIGSVGCMEYKVLYNKSRRRVFEPPFVVKKSEEKGIIYPGTLVTDWQSEGTGIMDILVAGGGSWVSDKGEIAIKVEDRTSKLKAYLNEQNPELLKKFNLLPTEFKDHPDLIQ